MNPDDALARYEPVGMQDIIHQITVERIEIVEDPIWILPWILHCDSLLSGKEGC
jgi:hypothetical protein